MIAIKVAFVTPENFEELFSLIEKTLLENRQTLVFIENQIYLDLCKKADLGANSDCNYKFYSAGEHILIETLSSTPLVVLASFTNDCGDFKQLVDFRSSKIRYYMRDMDNNIGFQPWLLIQYKT